MSTLAALNVISGKCLVFSRYGRDRKKKPVLVAVYLARKHPLERKIARDAALKRHCGQPRKRIAAIVVKRSIRFGNGIPRRPPERSQLSATKEIRALARITRNRRSLCSDRSNGGGAAVH